MLEEQLNIDEYIVVYGHKALGYYKERSWMLKNQMH